MTPVDQEFLHDPANGSYGDCQRAAIASILNLPLSAVPHFNADNTDVLTFHTRLKDFLATKNLGHYEFTAFDFTMFGYPEPTPVYHLIYGMTERGFQHAVVGYNGEVVHDPHPSKAGLLPDKGQWSYGLLLPTFQGTKPW